MTGTADVGRGAGWWRSLSGLWVAAGAPAPAPADAPPCLACAHYRPAQPCDAGAQVIAALERWGDDIPRGPWKHRRSRFDGALLLEAADGEPIAQLYAGYPLARYLEALAPAVLSGEPLGE